MLVANCVTPSFDGKCSTSACCQISRGAATLYGVASEKVGSRHTACRPVCANPGPVFAAEPTFVRLPVALLDPGTLFSGQVALLPANRAAR